MFKRGKIWYFSINGVKESSGTADRERAKALERKRNQEEFDRAHGFHVPTWDEACLSWLEENRHRTSYPMQCIVARWWQPRLTGRKLAAITKQVVHEAIKAGRPIDELKPSKKNSTANTYVFFVEKIIRSASNLTPEFRNYLEPNEEKRWLRPDEWRALVPVMDEDLRHICTFALMTGLREKNDMRFEWEWIHDDKAYLPAALTKTAEPYGIPLNRMAQAVIEERRQAKIRHSRYVFTNHGKMWTCSMLLRKLHKAVERAGLQPMTFHSLRHTFGSWLAQRGVSDAVRCRLGCWSTGGSASRYVHFDVESLRPFSDLLVSCASQPEKTGMQVVDSGSFSA